MLNGRYFKEVETLEDLKRQYRTLAMKNHPDRGGDVEVMKMINAEYDSFFAQVKDIHKTHEGKVYQKENKETPEEFKHIIDELLKMDGVEIEIIGCFIWVSGNTKPNKDAIKALGFIYHGKKKMWFRKPADYKKKSRRTYEMEEIRNMYGTSGTFTGKGKDEHKQLGE